MATWSYWRKDCAYTTKTRNKYRSILENVKATQTTGTVHSTGVVRRTDRAEVPMELWSMSRRPRLSFTRYPDTKWEFEKEKPSQQDVPLAPTPRLTRRTPVSPSCPHPFNYPRSSGVDHERHLRKAEGGGSTVVAGQNWSDSDMER